MLLAMVLGSLPAAAADPCAPCRVRVIDGHPHEALRELLSGSGITVVLEGNARDPITIDAEETSLDHLIRKLARAGGYLVARRADTYVLYGDDLDEITATQPLVHLTAAEAAEQLDRFEDVTFSVLRDANALLLRGSAEALREAVSLLETIDHERPNIFLEVLVVEYFHGDSFEWGFDVVEGQKSKVSDLLYAPGLGTLSGLYEVIADLPESFRLNLRALAAENQARVVTNPHVAVRNGESGTIDFQEELHIVVTNDTENFGVTRELEELEAGVKLEVVPQVLASRAVDLDVRGEVAVFVRAPEGQFAIDRQIVATKVLVNSGGTLVIGGLVRRKLSREESGVPFLRRIPLLGRLFEQELIDEQFVETVVYITPYIADPSAFAAERMRADVDAQFSDQ